MRYLKTADSFLIFACIFALLLCLTSSAKEDQSKDTDISDLQDSYWRPNKDDLEVVENRRFDKTGRMELGTSYGIYQGGDYVNTHTLGIELSYNWNNSWFTELSFLKMQNSNSDFLNTVRSYYGFTPNYNVEHEQYSIAMGWTPIYAKFSLLGKEISHFETYIAPGIGVTKTVSDHTTEHLSIGEKFFLTNHLIFFLEWKISHYEDTIPATQGTPAKQNGGPGYFNQTETKNNILFGIGWLF